ncbi:MAG: PHP domain-containing protein [Actinomycetia bacterium]|nr:PHP domain-containing protein [Actinomycetes bacterium]
MKADLHIHTWCSTGTQTPAEVLHEAAGKGIGLVSITDDDTTDAYREIPEIAAQYGIRYIPGVEVSATAMSAFRPDEEVIGIIHAAGGYAVVAGG